MMLHVTHLIVVAVGLAGVVDPRHVPEHGELPPGPGHGDHVGQRDAHQRVHAGLGVAVGQAQVGGLNTQLSTPEFSNYVTSIHINIHNIRTRCDLDDPDRQCCWVLNLLDTLTYYHNSDGTPRSQGKDLNVFVHNIQTISFDSIESS